MIDFVTTAKTQEVPPVETVRQVNYPPVFKPDKVFACTGKDLGGAVSEIRYGLEARIGLEADCGSYISQAWSFQDALPKLTPEQLEQTFIAHHLRSPDSYILLALSDSSLLLRLTADASSVDSVGEHCTCIDLASKTLAAASHEGIITQITEKSLRTFKAGSM
jgi:hypothetical protein